MGWTHIEDRKPKARKEYRCHLCDRTIQKGEVYVRRFGYDDGGVLTTKMHTFCESLTHNWEEADWECHDVHEFRELIDHAKSQQH